MFVRVGAFSVDYSRAFLSLGSILMLGHLPALNIYLLTFLPQISLGPFFHEFYCCFFFQPKFNWEITQHVICVLLIITMLLPVTGLTCSILMFFQGQGRLYLPKP